MALSTLHSPADELTLQFVAIDAPDWYINPNFKVILAPEAETICGNTPITLAPQLEDILQSDTPPDPEWFLTLTLPPDSYWVVYAVLLEKDGLYKLCIGSGTNAEVRHIGRTPHYSDKKHTKLPRFVRLAYDDGYEMLNLGALCWAPKPPPHQVPRARLRFLGLEGTFTNLFFSAIETIMDPLWTDLVPWSRKDVEWEPLNSHTPFDEGVEGLQLTPEELAAAAELRRQQRNATQNARYSARRLNDPQAHEAYLAQQSAYSAARWDSFRKNDPQGHQAYLADHNAAQMARRAANQESRLFECEPCGLALQTAHALAIHEGTDGHKDVVNGRVKAPSANALAARKYRAAKKATKANWCSACSKGFATPAALRTHNGSKMHRNNVALASAADDDTEDS